MDGTLVKVYGAGRKALEEAYAIVHGQQSVARHLDAEWFAGKTDLYIFREVALRAGIAPVDYDRRYSELESCYLGRLRDNVEAHPGKEILPGIERLLEALTSRRHLLLGLMTGNLEGGARIKLEPWNLNRFFLAGGFGSDALDRRDIGRIAHARFEERLGFSIRPEEVLVVGDTPADIAAARACGFKVLAVGSGWTDEADLRAAAPDHYFPDLSDTAAVLLILEK